MKQRELGEGSISRGLGRPVGVDSLVIQRSSDGHAEFI